MKAAVFQGPGKPLVIEDVPDPEPEAGELLLKVKNCGICGTDLHCTEEHDYTVRGGTLLGHEFSGEIVGIGNGVEGDWKLGDRVCALPFIGCGTCRECVNGDPANCLRKLPTGFTAANGAFAEYVRVGTRETVKLPASVSFREGALVEPLAVGLRALKLAQLPPGGNVLVIGAGPIGLAVCLWAKVLGAAHVVVKAKTSRRFDLASKFGATGGIDATQDAAVEFSRLTGHQPDCVFECVGVPGLIEDAISLAGFRGQVVVAGACMKPDVFNPLPAILKEITIKFSNCYRTPDFRYAIDMIAADRIDVDAMITDVITLDALPDAFEALRNRSNQCKVMWEAA